MVGALNRLPGMGNPPKLRSAQASCRGLHRDENQDSILIEEKVGMFAVADGMGGQGGGAEASAFVCAVLASQLLQEDIPDDFNLTDAQGVFETAVAVAVDGMRNLSDVCPRLGKMGTTLVAAWFVDGKCFYAHSGHSRLYLLRDKRLQRLTKDHSIVELLCDRGVIAEHNRDKCDWRHYLTRYIGPGSDNTSLDVASFAVKPHDRIILMTNGITETLEDSAIRRAANIARSPQELCRWLVIAARAANAPDDISCVAIDVEVCQR